MADAVFTPSCRGHRDGTIKSQFHALRSVFPMHIEDLVGEEPNAKTPGEYITYHEAGHDFAYALKIRSGNSWVNELVVNMFMAAYIDAKRPDLKWALEGPEAHGMKQAPRYTSLRDLDYVYAPGVGPQNYVWFQSLYGPTTLALIRPSPCPTQGAETKA
jgi:hypothetical protein